MGGDAAALPLSLSSSQRMGSTRTDARTPPAFPPPPHTHKHTHLDARRRVAAADHVLQAGAELAQQPLQRAAGAGKVAAKDVAEVLRCCAFRFVWRTWRGGYKVEEIAQRRREAQSGGDAHAHAARAQKTQKRSSYLVAVAAAARGARLRRVSSRIATP